MIAIPICILALAAGVALLIKVKTVGLSGLYRALSWLVILLSLLYMSCLVVRGIMHHRHMVNMRNEREARFKEFQNFRMKRDSIMMKGDTSMMKDSTMKGMSCGHMMGGGKMMGGCCEIMKDGCLGNMDGSCCGEMEMKYGGGFGWHHHGGRMHGGWMNCGDGKGAGCCMPKDSTTNAKK